MSTAKKIPTIYEIRNDLPEGFKSEIINGNLIVTPRPALPHSRAAFVISSKLGGPYDLGNGGPGGWLFLIEPEIHLHGDIRVPDIAAWKKERLPSIPNEPFITLAPDWVCEILSPATEKFDRNEKMHHYGRYGVKYVWLIDPVKRYLETFLYLDGNWVLDQKLTEKTKAPLKPFEQNEFDLGDIWV